MILKLQVAFLFVANLTATNAGAQSASGLGKNTQIEWQIKSNFDEFSVIKRGGSYFLGETKVETNSAFKDIEKLFTQAPLYDCGSLPEKPDLHITQVASGKKNERKIYLKGKIITDGKDCIEASGQGIYYLPYHRAWFVNEKNYKINIDSDWGIAKNNQKWFTLRKVNHDWEPEDNEGFLNWQLIDSLMISLDDFKVLSYVHPGIVNDLAFEKPRAIIELKTKNHLYKFHNVREQVWLLKHPDNNKWLIAADTFGVFNGLSRNSFVSPLNKELSLIAASKTEEKQKLSLIRKLRARQDKELRELYYKILKNLAESVAVKTEICRVLRNFPSRQNGLALVAALDAANDFIVLEAITSTLRVQNPKGPVITDQDDKPTTDEKIATWKSWAEKLNDAKK